MSALNAFILLAAVSTGTAADHARPMTVPVSNPGFQQSQEPGDGLVLYNADGEVVARCEKKDGKFSSCRLEKGYTLDDLMNAWVHAYEELEK